jgi:anti-sigma28 factor (negative regulator of flagellin synthesis)
MLETARKGRASGASECKANWSSLVPATSSKRLMRGTVAANLFAQRALQDELVKLGSVLNGLETGARQMRQKVRDLAARVRSGNYKIDALELSRRIVQESLSFSV